MAKEDLKPKDELPTNEAIVEAIEEVKLAMIEKIDASRAETEAQIRKRKAHYQLQKANERLNGLYMSLMSYEK